MNKHRLLGILMLFILYGAVFEGGIIAVGFWPAFWILHGSILLIVWIGITAELLAKKPTGTEEK